METKAEKLTSIIQEMDEIEALAASIQSEGPRYGSKATEEEVTRLRERYLDWYARARKATNQAGQRALHQHYAGGGYNIHSYLGDPRSSYSGRRGYGSGETYHAWRKPFDRNFRDPFNEQRLLLMRILAGLRAEEADPAPPPPPAIDTIRLHSRVRAVSSKLFKDGHYRQAILQACLAFNQAVQERSGRSDIDGTKLMQQTFSTNKPILKFDSHPDEQQGYMWLFSGVSMAIRNPRAHRVGEAEDLDANEALELLAVVSACFRALDRANGA